MSNTTKLYPPELYKLIHVGNEGDVDFYVNACSDAETVLELGCGFGRLLAPLARAGYAVTGVDLHPGLLAEAEKSTKFLTSSKSKTPPVKLVEGDMRTIDLGKKFDRVLLAYNALFCLETDDEVRACFQSVANHLSEDGLFIFDTYPTISLFEDIEEIGDASIEEEAELYITIDDDPDYLIEVYESSVWTPSAQRYEATFHYAFTEKTEDSAVLDEESEEPDGFIETHSIVHHYLNLDQIRDLLEASGLRIALVAGDFDGGPYDDEESENLIVVATLAQHDD